MNKFETKLRHLEGDFRSLIGQKRPEGSIKKEFMSIKDRFNISDSNLNTISNLVFLGYEYGDTYNIPDYQRELVWTTKQKQKLIMSVLRGFPIGNFTFRYDGTDEVSLPFSVIDGQQRLQALREFAIGELPLEDGRKITDLSYWDARAFFDYREFKAFKIKNISREDEITLYLEINDGGTIVAFGTPEQVAQVSNSYTGQFLNKLQL